MSVEDVLFELKRKVQSKLPPDINVTGLEFEGPELVIYTDDPKKLADDGEIIRNLARAPRRGRRCRGGWRLAAPLGSRPC